MIYALIFFVLLTLILGFIVWNLFQQNQQLEGYIKEFDKVEEDAEKFYRVILGLLVQTYAELLRVDKRGSFAGDDEVGFSFRVILKAIESCKHAIEQMKIDTKQDESQGQ